MQLSSTSPKNRKRRIAAVATATTLAISGVVSVIAFANATETYEDDYTYKNMLRDYQYVVEHDLIGSGTGSHTVGGVVVGGDFNLGINFGNLQHVASYIENVQCSQYTSNDWLQQVEELREMGLIFENEVYYNTTEVSVPEDFIQNADYMDVPELFTELRSQSEELASEGTSIGLSTQVIEGAEVQVLQLDFSLNKNYVIQYDDFYKASVININDDDVDGGKVTKKPTDVGSSKTGATITLSLILLIASAAGITIAYKAKSLNKFRDPVL